MKEAGIAVRGRQFGVIAAMLLGALWAAGSAAGADGSLPLTNRQTAERALTRALEGMAIPEGNGLAVRCRAETAGPGSDLLPAAAVEYLVGRGYRVGEGEALPEFRFTLDTLYVRIDRPGWVRRKTAERVAEARVGAEFLGARDTRMVFRGQGRLEDAFPAGMLDHTGWDDPFLVGTKGSFGTAKPVFFGLVVTGLIWLLYSYRG